MTRLLIVLLGLGLTSLHAQESKTIHQLDKSKKVYIVQASCGSCNFKMKVPGCPLAIKLDDKYYLVDGAKLDDYGDAHAEDGFCNVIKKAKVQGDTSGSVFKATYFELVKREKSRISASKN